MVEGLALDILDEATRRGAEYADVRVVRQRTEVVETRDGALEQAGEQRSSGYGVRVLVGGAWGFAAQGKLERETIAETVGAALSAARAAAGINSVRARSSHTGRSRPVELAPTPAAVDTYRTPFARDPFSVSLDEKQELLLRAERNLRAPDTVNRPAGFKLVTNSHLISFFTEKVFCSSEGAKIRQDVTECGAALFALAVGSGKPARRSFDNYGQAGWEFIQGLDLPGQATRVGEEAVQLLDAPYVEAGTRDVVLGSSQLALMVHETCGHPTELDRVLGFEDAFAGGSFLQPEDLGRLRYGSEHVNLTADSTLPLGLGTFGYDDDGVAARRFYLVRDGVFCGYLSSRDTAPMIGQAESTGCSRASGWDRVPIVRMVNVSLEPGEMSLDELIGGVEDGLYLDSPSSWSLDDKRLNFHFGVEYGRVIKNGKLAGEGARNEPSSRDLRRGATIQAITPEFWGKCDGVAGPDAWELWGFLSCAKGEPLQGLHVGHGAAPARFRSLAIGVER